MREQVAVHGILVDLSQASSLAATFQTAMGQIKQKLVMWYMELIDQLAS